MRKEIIYLGKVFKSYDDYYYVSADGDVYSNYIKRTLKKYIDKDGYERVDIHSRHVKVHKLVYITWVGKIPSNMQINHKDDNKRNNHYNNLYLGNQKQNTNDRIENGHSIGNMHYLLVYDKLTDKLLLFVPAFKFFDYAGHHCKNKNIKRVLSRNWFNERYICIAYEKINNLNMLEGLTTRGDECSPVGWSIVTSPSTSPVISTGTNSLG